MVISLLRVTIKSAGANDMHLTRLKVMGWSIMIPFVDLLHFTLVTLKLGEEL